VSVEDGLARAVADHLGTTVEALRPVAGGDVNEAFGLELGDGRRAFAKTRRAVPDGFFAAEARGLAWLAEAPGPAVPEVLGILEDPPALLLAWIEAAPAPPGGDARLGRELAALHAAGAPGFGGEADNFIGPLPQSNRPRADWATFYAEERLAPRIRAARDAGRIDAGLARGLDELRARLPARVGPAEPPARLHGDLWGGNALFDAGGRPWLIDPAAYGGHREVDLAMMLLFGGFGPDCFAAYHEAHPLAPGWRERTPLYQLYPLLVHVELFGAGYAGSLRRALAAVA